MTDLSRCPRCGTITATGNSHPRDVCQARRRAARERTLARLDAYPDPTRPRP